MAMIRPDETLPCGMTLQPLLMQVADGQPVDDAAHQKTCPYCQAALRRLQQGWGEVQMLTRQPVAVPRGLTAMIMARIRTLAGYVADSILLGHPNGETRISHTVLGRVIQHTAGTVPGVIYASVKVSPLHPPHPRRVNVVLRLVVIYGPVMQRIATAVREILRRRIPALTGGELERIDVTITDLVGPSDSR